MAELTVTPHTKQLEALRILSDPEISVLFYGGARGGGKSHLSRLYVFMRALKYPGSKSLIVRSSYPDLTRAVIDVIKQEYKGVYSEYLDKAHTFKFSNGSTIECTYIAHEHDLETIQGAEYSTIILEEAGQHSRKVFDLLRLSLRTTEHNIKVKMLCTFNWMGKGFGWLKKLCWDKVYDEGMKPESISFLRATVKDNPSLFDNSDYMDMLKALPEALRKRNLEGDPTGVADGQFFSEFSTTLIEPPFILTRDDMNGRLFGSLDTGTTHATAFKLGYIDRKNAIHILFSYCKTGQTIAAHAQEIFDAIDSFTYTDGFFPSVVFADPASFTKVKLNAYMIRSPINEYEDLFKERGKITKFERANNDRVHGSQIMRSLFASKQIRYFAGYNNSFVRAMQSVTVDPNNMESYLKTSSDEDDDADASRYLIVGCHSVISGIKQKEKTHRRLTDKERVLAGHFSPKSPDGFYENDLKYI